MQGGLSRQSTTESYRQFRDNPGQLTESERWWVGQQKWLEECGYKLRLRYQPDWEPSWKSKGVDPDKVEDGQLALAAIVMDATRMSDGVYVILKRVYHETAPFEVELDRLLSSEPQSLDPRNHCVPTLDVLQVPNDDSMSLIVMPLLRPWDSPRFLTYGEACALFYQLFEGLQFLHEQHIAHRDCTDNNIMMDASSMFKHPWHPVKADRRRDWKGKAKCLPRTERPPKYYFTDFGHARKYNPDDGPARELPLPGGDHTVPEHQREHWNTPHDPFATDIYYLGNLIRMRIMMRWSGFDFMKPLVADMVHQDPSKRPDIHEVVERYDNIVQSLNAWKLRSRVTSPRDFPPANLWRVPIHFFRTAGYILRRKHAIPIVR